METKFRPVPLSILDFLGVLIPGFLWLMLFIETWDALTRGVGGGISPPAELQELSRLATSGGSWFGPIAIVFAALTAGYSIKLIAMRIANRLAMPFFSLLRERYGLRWRDMSFPYREYFRRKPIYHRTCQILEELIGMKPEELPRAATFTAAKRYLHALAPSLWEESERLEAEVRLLGSLFLAAMYSTLLHAMLSLAGLRQGLAWAVFSLVAACVLGLGFDIARFREVAYTYLNVVIAAGALSKSSTAPDAPALPPREQLDD